MNAIIASIYEHPEEWSVSHYHFCHKDGVSIWCANGFFFFQVETGGSFNLWQRIRAYIAYRWWVANAPLEAIS